MNEAKGPARSGKDRDGNRWEIGGVHDPDRPVGRRWRVAIYAEACWLTRAESIRFTRVLQRAIADVALKNKRRKA